MKEDEKICENKNSDQLSLLKEESKSPIPNAPPTQILRQKLETEQTQNQSDPLPLISSPQLIPPTQLPSAFSLFQPIKLPSGFGILPNFLISKKRNAKCTNAITI